MSQIPVQVAAGVQVETVAQRMNRLRRAILSAVTPEKVAAIMEKMQEKAVEGNVAAAKLVMGYIFGQPGRSIDKQIDSYVEDSAEEAMVLAAGQGAGELRIASRGEGPKVNGVNGVNGGAGVNGGKVPSGRGG